MISTLKTIFGLVKSPWLIAGVLALAGTLYVGYNHIRNLEQTITEKESTIKKMTQVHENEISSLNSEITKLIEVNNNFKVSLEETNKELARVRKEMSEIDRERREVESKLVEAMGRQEIVWQKPKLVERFLRNNWRETVNEMSCVTGVLEKCKEN